MVKLFEFMRKDTIANVGKLSDLGALTFGPGISDKNEDRTPHYEINKCLQMLEQNPIVASSIAQLILFIIPNKTVKISSEDEATVEFLEKWHAERRGFISEIRNILTTNITCGNGPLEKSWTTIKNKGVVLDNIFSENDMNRIYVNPDDPDGDTAFIFELPFGIKQFNYRGEVQLPSYYNVTYIKNYSWFVKRIWGIPIPAHKMSIYQSGWSRDNIYGRSMLTSAIDVDNIYREILSSWDTIAKTRQLDQKILTVDTTDGGVEIDQKRLDKLGEQLEDADKSYTLFNFPLKMLQQDIKTSGNYDLMEGVMDSVRRMLMLSLLPQHLTPWSDSGTTQGSEASMPPFLGRLKAKQNEFINFLNTEVIDELRKSYPWLALDASYILDEPKIMSDDYYIRMVVDMVSSELMTKEQGQEYLARIGIISPSIVEGVDVGNAYGKENLQEAVNADVGFFTWKKRLDSKIKTNGWKQLKSTNIGGKITRLIVANNIMMIFDGLQLIDSFDLNNVSRSTVDKAYNDYNDKLKKMQDEFDDGDSEEDLIVDDMEKQVKDLLDKRLDGLFKMIGTHEVKKEGFLSSTVLDKIGDFFKGFNADMNKIVSQTMNKLDLTVKTGDNLEVDDKLNGMLKDKSKIMQKNIQAQINDTKDKMLVDIKKVVGDGIASGKSSSDIKKEVEKQFNYEDGVGYKFKRLASTELRNANSILKLKKWQKLGFETFEWISQIENNPNFRKNHRKNNHKIFSIDKALKAPSDDYDAYPGKAANCKCRMIPYN